MADLFLSYRFVHGDEVASLVAALQRAGVDVWRDVNRIRAADSITETVRDALASTRALAVYATPDYIDSLICAWELASAWIAGEGAKQATKRVILLRPPGVDFKDVRVGALQDTLAFDLNEGLDVIAAKVAEHLGGIDERTLGDLRPLVAEPPWWPLRRDGSNHFVGRWSQLWELHSKLGRSKTVGITGQVGRDTAQVRGLGGVGKSLLAIEYAKRFASAWPGGVFWIEGDPAWASVEDSPQARTVQRETMLASLASALGVSPIQGDLSATAAAVVRALHRQLTDKRKRYLWVLDNVPRGTKQALLEALGPPVPGGATLLTTRWRALTSLGEHLDLVTLDPSAAQKLLTGLHKPRDEDERRAAESLAKAVGYHPLALDVLRAQVELTALSQPAPYATWTARLADPSRDRLDEAAATIEAELPTGCARAITQVLVTSLDDLPETALDILRLASVLAEEPIPGTLLADALEEADGIVPTALDGALAKLLSRSLISQTPSGVAILVHALVRRVAQHWRCDMGRLDALARGARGVLGRRFDDVLDVREHGPLIPLVAHALANADGDSLESATVGLRLGIFFQVRGDFSSARDCYAQALTVRKHILGPDHPQTLAALQNLAGTLGALGDLDAARSHYERALSAQERILGPDHDDTLATLQNLAGTLYEQGDFTAARAHCKRALDARERIFGRDHPDTLGTLQNLAGILLAQGDLATSRELSERALAVRERVLGPDHPDTLATVQNLAGALYAQGHFATARDHYERALAGRKHILGLDHPDTLITQQNLAATLTAQGELIAARALCERVFAARERVLGPEHPKTLSALQHLAGAFFELGDIPAARNRYEQALSAQERILGHSHPDTLVTRHGLAGAFFKQGDLATARERCEENLTDQGRTLGPDHPSTLTTMHNLAGILCAQGNLAGARGLFKRALAGREHTLGPDHPETLTTMHGLARILHAQGDFAVAQEYFERAFTTRERILGHDHPDTLASLHYLAETFYTQGDLAAARERYEQALYARERILEPDHLDTLATLRNLAGTLYAQGDLAGAREHCERVLIAQERILGPDHPETLVTLQNLAGTHDAAGDFVAAHERFEQLLTARERTLGPDHPDTLTALHRLAKTLYAQGDVAAARERYEHVLYARGRILGPDHPDTLATLQSLAGTFFALGDLTGARERYERALTLQERILGPNHLDTMVTRFNLVLTHRELKTDASPHLEKLRPLLDRPSGALSEIELQIVSQLPTLLAEAEKIPTALGSTARVDSE